jgi:hypothetical protein
MDSEGCGDPYARHVQGHGVKREAVDFLPPLVIDTSRLSQAEIEREG